MSSMGDEGVHPAYIHAFEVCGYLVTTDNEHRFTDEELTAWDNAVQEWYDQHPDDPGP